MREMKTNLKVNVTGQVEVTELEKVRQIARLVEEAQKLIDSLKTDLQVRSELQD